MAAKVIDMRDGDGWTKDKDGVLWIYRGELSWPINSGGGGPSSGEHPCPASYRYPHETDIPTPEAHAQLREWGYEVRGEEPEGDYGQIMRGETPPLTESRVREIVEEVLAERSHTGHYSHAVDDARVKEIVTGMLAARRGLSIDTVDQIVAETKEETRVKMLAARAKPAPTTDDWRARCRVWQPTPEDSWWAVYSPSGKYAIHTDGGWAIKTNDYLGRNFDTESAARAALAKAPPPPDVSPEPDWRGLLAELVNRVEDASFALAAAGKAVGK